jgi:MATE family multidrug resistance protein
MYDGIFIGATMTGLMLRAMVVAVAAYAVAVAMLPPVFGNHGLWAALTVLNGARSLLMWRLAGAVVGRAA